MHFISPRMVISSSLSSASDILTSLVNDVQGSDRHASGTNPTTSAARVDVRLVHAEHSYSTVVSQTASGGILPIQPIG